jgi:hypothetical protein
VALYHFKAKVISRGKGQSAVAASAYQSRERLYSQWDSQHKDYTRKAGQEVLFTGIYAPKDAPEWTQDREQLWNRAEAAERRKDAQLARGFDVALMADLTPEQNRYALQDFIRETFTRSGYVADVAIHAAEAGGDQRNLHAHILTTLRPLEKGAFSAKKDRSQNTKETLEHWREAWAKTAARHLLRHGFAQEAERMEASHLSLEAQRRKALERGDEAFAASLDREATQHLGATATRMERDGRESERGEVNREIEAENRRRRALHKGFEDTAREIAELEAKQRLELEERQKAAQNREPAHTFERLKASRDLRAGLPPRPEVSPAPEDKREKTAREAAEAFDRLMSRGKIREKPPQAPQPHENDHQKAAREALERLNARQGRPQPSRQTQAGRAFAKLNQPQQTPEPPKRQSEQREAFNEAARAPQEAPRIWQPETRRRGEGDAPTLKRQPRAQTAEEMRERMKNRSGRERTREPDRD